MAVLPDDSRDAATDAIVALVDAGSGPGELRVYSGSLPATRSDLPAGTLLAAFELKSPAFGASSAGTATLDTPDPVEGAADGTAACWVIVDSDEQVVVAGTVTATGGGGDLSLNTTAITEGLEVSVTAPITVTMPSGA